MATPSDDILRARAQWSASGHPRPDAIAIPGPDQESVWSFPRPPRVERCIHPVRVLFGGEQREAGLPDH